MSDIADVIGGVSDIVGDSTDIMIIGDPNNRSVGIPIKFFAIAIIIMAVIFMSGAISDTVKYYTSVEDYHLLSSTNIRYGQSINGTIDEWYGPYGSYKDGREIYLLTVDNGQFITYITDDEKQKEAFIADSENGADSVKIKLKGKIQSMSDEQKRVMIEALAEQGIPINHIDEKLIRYTLVNDDIKLFDFRYKIGIVMCGLGILMLLPDLGDFIGRMMSKKNRREAMVSNTVTSYSYPNPNRHIPAGQTNRHIPAGQKRD